MKFNGHGVLGYEAHKKHYTGVWTDSVASVMLISEGQCEKNGHLNTMIGKAYDPMKKRMITTCKSRKSRTPTQRFSYVRHLRQTQSLDDGGRLQTARSENNNGAKSNGPFTHTIAGLGGVHYYLGGPQQARPPEGKFKPGTRVKLVRKAGSYSVVQSETGITAHVATAALKPIGK